MCGFEFAVMIRLVRLSLGATFQYLVQMASWIASHPDHRLVRKRGGGGEHAGHPDHRLRHPAVMGLEQCGCDAGGAEPGRREAGTGATAVWRTGLYNMLFLGVVGVVFISFAEPIIGLFTSDPNVVPMAATALRYFSYGYISYGYGMVIAAAFNGAGDTLTPTILNLIGFWLCQIPLAYFLAVSRGMGPRGVYVSVVVADTLLALMGIYWFRRGAWKRQVV